MRRGIANINMISEMTILWRLTIIAGFGFGSVMNEYGSDHVSMSVWDTLRTHQR